MPMNDAFHFFHSQYPGLLDSQMKAPASCHQLDSPPPPPLEACQRSNATAAASQNLLGPDAMMQQPAQQVDTSTQSMGTRLDQPSEAQQQATAHNANLVEDSSASKLKPGPFTEGARAILEQVQQAGMQRASFRQLGQRE